MTNDLLLQKIAEVLVERSWLLSCAESCTGGGISAAVTSLAGSSQWFDRGFVTYSNQSKQDMLGVQVGTLETFGAVSEATVCEMASGALLNSQSQIAVAVSGIAGPDGGSEEKPVGTVCLAWAQVDAKPIVVTQHFDGDRTAVREQAVVCALQGLLDLLVGRRGGV